MPISGYFEIFLNSIIVQKRTLKTSEMKIILNWKLAAASQEERSRQHEVKESISETN